MLEQQLIEIDGATLEVFLGGTGEPVICQSHPFDARTAALEEFATVLEVQERLGGIKMPTLLVMCGKDEFFPLSYGEVLRAGIPHAEYVVLEESAHSTDPASADGARYREAARRFLASRPTRRAQ